MESLSKKVFLKLEMPNSQNTKGDRDKIFNALKEKYGNVTIPYKIIKELYPKCREANFEITVTLVKRDYDWVVTRVEAGDTTDKNYGLCVDLGSTTVIMRLVDLNTGDIIAEESIFNKQIAFGEDILNRIFYTRNSAEKLYEVHKATVDTFGELLDIIGEQTGVKGDDISIMTVAGNTTMTHFLLNIDPWTIFQTPYTPIFNQAGFIKADEIDIPINGYVYCFPSVANYFGGDVVSGILFTEIHKQQSLSAFIDIGTNGELVMGNEDFLVAVAGAAGPALEGGISKFGMRARKGAIDTIKIVDNEIKYTTIQDGKPLGICGSGIVDLLSEMLLNGWVDFSGEIKDGASKNIIKVDDQLAVEYASREESENHESLIFTQSDINQFLKTKSAAHTMVAFLLEEIGLTLDELEEFYVAGAFGTHLDIEAAVTIGMYPDLQRDRFNCPGNSSLKGAYKLLMNRNLLSEIDDIAQRINYIGLEDAKDFIGKMRAASFLPHTDIDNYPSVKAKLIKKGLL
ncbi:ASKHA domain-containing protein [Intestinibacter sp.]